MIKLIHEASEKSERKYTCPYCEERFTRNKLYSHIENKHEEMITDEFPVGRIVYNTVNKRTEGSCMVCKKPTKWDDKKQRYDSFCSEECKQEYVKLAKERMRKKYGKEYLLDDPDHQNKMLQGRRISGYYTFTSGGKMPYVGSYERKFLEFMDKVLQVKTIDIIPSYPIVKYEDRNKEEHFWILDYYYVPANLAIDIKDGGDNPNNREMPEYREKQRQKEIAIAQQQEYNYIRLEDNKFDQFLLCLVDLKEMPEEDIKFNTSIRTGVYRSYIPTHESTSTMGTIKGIGSEPNIIRPQDTIYFVKSCKYAGGYPRLGIARDKTLRNLVFSDDEFRLRSFGLDYLRDSVCRVYEYTDDNVEYNYLKILQKVNENSDDIYTAKDLYKQFTGKDLLDFDQIDYTCKECTSYPEYLKILESSLLATWTDGVSIPMLESTDITCIYEYAQDINGYYIYNKETGLRSRSYETKKEIPSKVIDFISCNGLRV